MKLLKNEPILVRADVNQVEETKKKQESSKMAQVENTKKKQGRSKRMTRHKRVLMKKRKKENCSKMNEEDKTNDRCSDRNGRCSER
ncbi:hypothetical protein Pint_32829 [Pistacia integerrima]|uniref:Uncharacterized protein n=1 Tax=Pistacia integerrima TaxID=434235 RepID=A0ACC0X6S1_9ROSI|nr:hypothetical protein Pint_32829 [Pistacia integerrima]